VDVARVVFTVQSTVFGRPYTESVEVMHSERRINVVIEPRVVSGSSAPAQNPSSWVCIHMHTV